jgi:hypothetical protein
MRQASVISGGHREMAEGHGREERNWITGGSRFLEVAGGSAIAQAGGSGGGNLSWMIEPRSRCLMRINACEFDLRYI